MKKLLIGILLGSLLTGITLGFYFNKKTSFGAKTRTDKEKEFNYHTQTFTFIKTTVGDVNNDEEENEVQLRYTECWRRDEEGEDKLCIEPDEFCDKPFMEILVTDLVKGGYIAQSEKIYVGSGSGGKISITPFGKEKLIVVGGLNMGAHSSVMRMFKVEEGNIIPVCKNKAIFWGSECKFYSDRGSPKLDDLDGDGIPEVIEDAHDYSGDYGRDIVLGEVSVYTGDGFITQEGENYQKFLKLFGERMGRKIEVIDRSKVRKYQQE